MNAAAIRESESARRVDMLSVHSAKRAERRRRMIESAIIVALCAAVAACVMFGRPAFHSQPGAASVLTNTVAPSAPLTAENAPIVLKPLVKHKRKAKP